MMEKQLKCVLVLSLKEMALRKVTTLLLADSDMVASISKFRFPGYHSKESIKEWSDFVEFKIKNKLTKLELPELLEKQVIDVVKPIGLQIRKWKDCQENYLSSKSEKTSLPDSSKLFWTSAGIIDYRKTAEELVRCDALDVVQRYKLACINCLEDDIPLLWKRLPEDKKLYFYNKALYSNPTSPCLLFCWPHIVAGELSALDSLSGRPDRHLFSFNQWAFKVSAESGNRVAVEYFFHKLTYDEREATLTITVESLLRRAFRIRSKYHSSFRLEKFSDVSRYLLASMTPAHQMEIFSKHPANVLLAFLDCPWPDLFMENVGLVWDFLPPTGYCDFLVNMANRFALSDHYSPKLFREFFVQSPLDCKKCFIDGNSTSETPASNFLSTFFKSEDSESVETVFRNIDAADRMRLLLSEGVLRVFFVYMWRGWRMMKVCVREATQSEADRKSLKKAFIEHRVIEEIEWVYGGHFKRFFDFLDGADASGDKERKAQKRKLEDCCL